ncbi:hypothetical protein OY671_009598, partial [Metschnikowia pulcherrima]
AGRRHHHRGGPQWLGQDHLAGRHAHPAGPGVLGRPQLQDLRPPRQRRQRSAARHRGQPPAQPPIVQPAFRASPAVCGRGHAGSPHRPQRRRSDAPLHHGRGRRVHRAVAGARRPGRQGLAGHRQSAQAPRRCRPVARHRRDRGTGGRAAVRAHRPRHQSYAAGRGHVPPRAPAADRLSQGRDRPGGAGARRRGQPD